MKKQKHHLRSLNFVTLLLVMGLLSSAYANDIPPEKIFESFSECLLEKSNTKCDQILVNNIQEYRTCEKVMVSVDEICEDADSKLQTPCKLIQEKVGGMVNKLYLQQLLKETTDTSTTLLEYAKWLVEVQVSKTLIEFKDVFHKYPALWTPDLVLYLLDRGVYDRENTILVLQKTKDQKVLEVLATRKEPEALDFIMTNKDFSNQRYLVNFLDNEIVFLYLLQEVSDGKEIQQVLLAPLVNNMSNDQLDSVIDLISENKINKKISLELKRLAFSRNKEYMLSLFSLLSNEEFEVAATSNPIKLDLYVTKILNYYHNDENIFMLRLNTIFKVKADYVISYLKNNSVNATQSVALLRYIQRNFHNIATPDLLKIFENIQIKTAKDSSTLFSTASSKLPASELKKYFLNKFFKEKEYLSLEYIFEDLNPIEIIEIFKNADNSDQFIWTLFNQTEMEKETFEIFLKGFAAYNKSQGNPLLGKFETLALTNLDTEKLIEIFKLNDEPLSIKLIDIIVSSKTKNHVTESQLREIKKAIVNLKLRSKDISKITNLLRNILRAQKLATEVLLTENMQIDGLGTANDILDKLTLILSTSSESDGINVLTESELNRIIQNIEQKFFELKTAEVLKYLETLKRFTAIIKSGISEGVLKNSNKGLTSLLLNLYNKRVTDSPNISWSKLQNYNNLDFSELLRLYFYTKYELANASPQYLNGLSKENIHLILNSLEKIQKEMSQQIHDNRHSDSTNTEIPDVYEQNITEYFITTEDNPIDSQVLCDETLSCLFDFKYKNNLSFYTYFTTVPKVRLQETEYPLPAINGTSEVKKSDVKVFVSRNISITAPFNDVLFIDAFSIDSNPDQPLQGMYGQPYREIRTPYSERYCKKFAKWFGKCLDHGTREAIRVDVIQTNKNGTDGRAGMDGHNSPEVTLNFLNKKNSPFSKVLIFSSSGNGGAGANGGDRHGAAVAGNGGQGGAPGRVIPATISNNKYNIPVVEIQKMGSIGQTGATGN